MDIAEHTRALRETRMRVWNEAKNHLEDCRQAHPGQEMTAEENEKWRKLNERIDSIDAEVRQMVETEQRERDAAASREALNEVFGEQTVERAARTEAEELRSWFRGEIRRSEDNIDGRPNAIAVDIRAAARERELLRSGATPEEVRALLWDTGSIASGVPTSLSRNLYQYLEASIAALRMPTTKITTDSGEAMGFPRVNAHGIATQVIAQGTAIGGTDPTFARMTLDAFKYGQLVQVASEVIQDTGFDVVGFVGQNIGRAVGRVIDADLVVGTGTGEPLGMMSGVIVGAAGTVATGGSLITPTYEALVDLVYSVNDEYRSSGSAGFLTRDATAGVLRKLRDGAGGTVGAPMWQPSLTQGITAGEPDRLLGFPVWTDPNVASLASNARIMAFGDWNAYYVRLVGSLVIERSDDYAFNTDLVTFRGKQRVDGDYIDLTAVNLLKQSV
jgi:HK97 family phage major capsid protein